MQVTSKLLQKLCKLVSLFSNKDNTLVDIHYIDGYFISTLVTDTSGISVATKIEDSDTNYFSKRVPLLELKKFSEYKGISETVDISVITNGNLLLSEQTFSVSLENSLVESANSTNLFSDSYDGLELQKDNATILISAISDVEKLVSRDDNKPALNSLYFNENRIVGTDSFRLGVIDLPSETILPKGLIHYSSLNALKNILKIADSSVMLSDNTKFYVNGSCSDISFKTYFTQGRFETFPPYEKVLPTEYQFSVSLNKDNLLKFLQTLKSLKTKLVKITFGADELSLTTENARATFKYTDKVTLPEDVSLNLRVEHLVSNIEPVETENVVFSYTVNLSFLAISSPTSTNYSYKSIVTRMLV